ncbi:MAG: glycoside hydrolase family 95 protein [Clostridia bacterium]|nr:glycoside hydrolase family 95 protein [Clostridia bacterium]
MENLLYYNNEAKCFEEALPIGNGRLGAMVYGGVSHERISLNDDTAWSGTGKIHPAPDGAYEAYIKARELVLQNKIYEAQKTLGDGFLGMWSQVYMAIGNVYLDFGHNNVADYRRSLDIANAICAIRYKTDGVTYKREIIASCPDDVIAVKLSADKAKALSFTLSTDTQLKEIEREFDGCNYIFTLRCPSNGCIYPFVQDVPFIYDEAERGITVTVAIKVQSDGAVTGSDEYVRVENATAAVVYISIKTSFNGWNKNPDTEGLNHRANALKVLDKLNGTEYDRVKADHVKDYSALYGRVSLDLNSKNNTDTLTRLKNFDGSDLGLYELLFGFGRYLTIASSRSGTQATNLQGIWNEKPVAPWSSNYTLNINTQMNYWPTLITNLEECYEPFVALAKRLRESGTKTARDFYHARGFVSHHNSDLWAMTNPVGYKRGAAACVYSFWNMSSAWIACQLFDLYEYTLDREKLSEIYPIISDATLFYLDTIYKDEEGYMISPSTSPENHYVRDNDGINDANCEDMSNTDEFSVKIAKSGPMLSVSKTTAMSASLLKELFVIYLKASELLNVKNEITEKVIQILPELYPIKISDGGYIMEWAYDEVESDQNHRHLSHLYSLFPGNQISQKREPELVKACKKTLERRGDEGTGWGLAWKVNLWARLKEGNRALKLLSRILKLSVPTDTINLVGDGGGTFPNMFDSHPPFQIDGNFGVTAAICNMLMQSEIGRIELLPALPDAWKDGCIRGIVAKGNVKISMKWENGRVISLVMRTPLKQTVAIEVNGREIVITLPSDEDYTLI